MSTESQMTRGERILDYIYDDVDRELNPNQEDCWHCGGEGYTFDCFDGCCMDAEIGCGPGYSIERNDSNGNYEPSNCRWATKLEQARNRAGVYTPDEDAIIRDLASRGHTFPQISKALGKPVGSVQARAYRLRIRSGKPCNNGRSKFPRDDQHHQGSENV